MADANYDMVMTWLAVYEGGKVDDPDDPGGRTNRGVTQRVYSAFRRANGEQPRDVWLMDDDEHDDIYLDQYWRPIWGERLPYGVDAAMFDFAVHSGTSRSVKTAQRIVGATADGVMGNVTLAAILKYCEEQSARDLCWNICMNRLAFLKRLKVWWKYKNGWKRRVIGDHEGAQDDDFGVIDRSIMLTGTVRRIDPPKKPVAGKGGGDQKFSAARALAGIIKTILESFKRRK